MRIVIGCLVLILVLAGCESVSEELSCEIDEDCVADTCCHSSSCVNVDFKPDCEGVMCTMMCEPGTMDCGQGSCFCENNKCIAKIE